LDFDKAPTKEPGQIRTHLIKSAKSVNAYLLLFFKALRTRQFFSNHFGSRDTGNGSSEKSTLVVSTRMADLEAGKSSGGQSFAILALMAVQ